MTLTKTKTDSAAAAPPHPAVAGLPAGDPATELARSAASRSPTALRAALRDFYEDYAQTLDDDDLDGWVEYFVEDCHYRVQSRENWDAGLPIGHIYCMNKNMLRDRVMALRETTVAQPRTVRHFISGVRVNGIDGDRVEAQANFLITECLSDADPVVTMVGQYRDVVLIDGDDMRFVSRDCIVDNDRIVVSLIVPV